jgi:hypothetical protein
MVKAGYVEWDKKKKEFVNTDTGVPQNRLSCKTCTGLA